MVIGKGRGKVTMLSVAAALVCNRIFLTFFNQKMLRGMSSSSSAAAAAALRRVSNALARGRLKRSNSQITSTSNS